MLKLRDLRAVMRVVRTGSVTRAAAELNLSQPAITQAVRRVEEGLGFELFDRSHSGMRPTPVGEITARSAAQLFQHLVFSDEDLRNPAFKRVRAGGLMAFERTVSRSQLQTMVEVAECRSIEGAARRMGVSKTMVYRLLREIEEIVGADIFRREQVFANTPLGEVLVHRARLVFAELRALDEEVTLFRGRVEGRIVVGTLPSARTILVPRTIAELSRTHPDIRIAMIDKPYEQMVAELACGSIDVIVGSIRHLPAGSPLAEHVMFNDPIAILARPGHPIFDKAEIKLADLAQHKWVMPRQGVPSRDYFDRLFAEQGIAMPSNVVETDSLLAMRSLVIEDDRLALSSPYRASFEIEHGLMRVVPFSLGDFSLLFGYLLRAQGSKSPCLAAFVNTLRSLSSAEAQKRSRALHLVGKPPHTQSGARAA